MQLGRVVGTVVATVKVPGLTGVKLLVVQPLDRALRPVGGQVVAADAVHMAGPGELVYVVAAREAAQAMPDPFVPVDHAIVGIVDAVRTLAGDDPAAPRPSPPPAPGEPAGGPPASGPTPLARRGTRGRAPS
ncbi:MAG: EutN/CcmL family microcompartment protein [Chloroflexi bacterium]|nr:EutN/CcmL family microcompartment protein [Chloroflexota bacterium]